MFCPCCGKSIEVKNFTIHPKLPTILQVECMNNFCDAYKITGKKENYTELLRDTWGLEILFDQNTGKKLPIDKL